MIFLYNWDKFLCDLEAEVEETFVASNMIDCKCPGL